jgi:phosphatidylglycerol:prolipoprotein diacylglycerol transferase
VGVTVGSADLHVMLAVAFAVLIGPAWAAHLEQIDARTGRRAILLLALAALVGGRLHFLLNHAGAYQNNPWAALYLWRGGFHVPGAVVGLLAAAPVVARRFGLSVGKLMDAIVPAMGGALVIARLGCFLQGCCFGDVCHHAWCLSFPPDSGVYVAQNAAGILPSNAPHSQSVHPLQLYFIGSYLTMIAVALWTRTHKRYDGQVALVGFLVLFVSAFGLEFLRSNLMFRTYWGPVQRIRRTRRSCPACRARRSPSARRARPSAGPCRPTSACSPACCRRRTAPTSAPWRTASRRRPWPSASPPPATTPRW